MIRLSYSYSFFRNSFKKESENDDRTIKDVMISKSKELLQENGITVDDNQLNEVVSEVYNEFISNLVENSRKEFQKSKFRKLVDNLSEIKDLIFGRVTIGVIVASAIGTLVGLKVKAARDGVSMAQKCESVVAHVIQGKHQVTGKTCLGVLTFSFIIFGILIYVLLYVVKILADTVKKIMNLLFLILEFPMKLVVKVWRTIKNLVSKLLGRTTKNDEETKMILEQVEMRLDNVLRFSKYYAYLG